MTHDLAIIGAIGQILALCGLISIRMFTPAFLYFFMMRLALTHPDSMLASKMLRQFAEHASWQISPTFLTILGVLSDFVGGNDCSGCRAPGGHGLPWHRQNRFAGRGDAVTGAGEAVRGREGNDAEKGQDEA